MKTIAYLDQSLAACQWGDISKWWINGAFVDSSTIKGEAASSTVRRDLSKHGYETLSISTNKGAIYVFEK